MKLPFEKINRFFAQLRGSKSRIRKRFKRKFGYFPNLDDPRTFNEKIQWRKLHDHNPLMITCSDKFAVRGWVTDKVGPQYLVPLIATVDSADDIPWESLPEAFVIKASHGSGWTRVVFDKSECDREQITRDCRRWLKTNYYDSLREWQYKTIQPRLVMEELLLTPEGDLPTDYKFHCFESGETVQVFVLAESDRLTQLRHGYFDINWNKLPLYNADLGPRGEDFPRPGKLSQMIDLARTLSKGFGYVRVDLYNIGDRVYFGELTFNPASGMLNLTPREWNLKLGDCWKLPAVSNRFGAR